MVKSETVPAAMIATRSGELLLSAGRTELLALSSPVEPGGSWRPVGYRVVEEFLLTPEVEVEGARPEGGGGGRGWGRGPRWQTEADPTSTFSVGERYLAAIFLDRTRADEHGRHAAWSRASVTITGGLVLICVALVWRTTVRLAETKGVFETEARHLRELNQAAAGLARETRNPLGLIRGWAQRLIELAADGKGGESPCREQPVGDVAQVAPLSQPVPLSSLKTRRLAEGLQNPCGDVLAHELRAGGGEVEVGKAVQLFAVGDHEGVRIIHGHA